MNAVSLNKMLDHNQMDQPSPPAAQCKPACTPEFCSKHKRALCSAVSVYTHFIVIIHHFCDIQ